MRFERSMEHCLRGARRRALTALSGRIKDGGVAKEYDYRPICNFIGGMQRCRDPRDEILGGLPSNTSHACNVCDGII